jgi:exopolysaccharide production protein ExoQ
MWRDTQSLHFGLISASAKLLWPYGNKKLVFITFLWLTPISLYKFDRNKYHFGKIRNSNVENMNKINSEIANGGSFAYRRALLGLVTVLLVVQSSNAWYWPVDSQFGLDRIKVGADIFQFAMFGLFFALALTSTSALKLVNKFDVLQIAILFTLIVSTFLNMSNLNDFAPVTSIAIFVFTLLFVRNKTPNSALVIIAWSFLALLFISFVISFSNLGKMEGVHVGLWRGVFEHKNRFGPFAALAVPMIIFLKNRNAIGTTVFSTLFILSLACLLNSNSGGALVALAAALVCWLLLFLAKRITKRPRDGFLVYLILMSIVFSLIWLLKDEVLNTIGRDSSLTGRDAIWSYFSTYYLQKPMFGWGENTVIYRSTVLYSVQSFFGANYGTSHNAYLQLLLSGGILSLGLFIIYLAIIWLSLIHKYLKVSNAEAGPLFIVFVFFVFAMNVESGNGFGVGLLLLFAPFFNSSIKAEY